MSEKEKGKRARSGDGDVAFTGAMSQDEALERRQKLARLEGHFVDLTGEDDDDDDGAASSAVHVKPEPAFGAAPAAPAFGAAPAAPAFVAAPALRNPALAQELAARGIHHTDPLTDQQYQYLEGMLPEQAADGPWRQARVDSLTDARESGGYPLSVREGLGDEVARTQRQSECTQAMLSTLALVKILGQATEDARRADQANSDIGSEPDVRAPPTAPVVAAASGWGDNESRLETEAHDQAAMVVSGRCHVDYDATRGLHGVVDPAPVQTATGSVPLAGDVVCAHQLAQATRRLAAVARIPVPVGGLPGLTHAQWVSTTERAAAAIASNMALLGRVLPRRRTWFESCAAGARAVRRILTGTKGGRKATKGKPKATKGKPKATRGRKATRGTRKARN